MAYIAEFDAHTARIEILKAIGKYGPSLTEFGARKVLAGLMRVVPSALIGSPGQVEIRTGLGVFGNDCGIVRGAFTRCTLENISPPVGGIDEWEVYRPARGGPIVVTAEFRPNELEFSSE